MVISIEKEERLGNNESFPAQSVEKLQAVVLSSTSFASVECVRVVVMLEVNWSRVVSLNVELSQVGKQTQQRVLQA